MLEFGRVQDAQRLACSGGEAGLKGGSAEEPPLILRKEVKALWTTRPHSPALISLATRVGLTEAMDKAVTLIKDPKTSAANKRELTQLLAERRSEVAQRLLLQQFSAEKSSSRRIEIMTALQRFESDQIAPALLDRWDTMSSRAHETAGDGDSWRQDPHRACAQTLGAVAPKQ